MRKVAKGREQISSRSKASADFAVCSREKIRRGDDDIENGGRSGHQQIGKNKTVFWVLKAKTNGAQSIPSTFKPLFDTKKQIEGQTAEEEKRPSGDQQLWAIDS